MKTFLSKFRGLRALQKLILFIVALLTIHSLSGTAGAQENSNAKEANTQTAPKGTQRLKPLPRNEEGKVEAGEGANFLKRRMDWFFQPRAFPLGYIPQGARERALKQKMQMYQRGGAPSIFGIANETGFVTPPPAGPASAWFPIGPQPTSTTLFARGQFGGATSGRVTALVVNPKNANNVFLGGADGGLWVTTDGGTTWTSLIDNPLNAATATIAVGSLAVDPTSCGTTTICTTVYIGTGEDNFGVENVYGEGVLKCTVTAGTPPAAVCTQDNTFHTVSPLSAARGGPMIGALAVDRASGKQNILLAGVRGLGGTSIPSGIWCSSDSGLNWVRVLPTSATASDPGTDVAFASDGTAWVALGNPFGDATNNGIYKSSGPITSCTVPAAPTFTKQSLLSGLSTNIGRITLAIAPSDDTTLYAAIADSSTTSSKLLGFAKTTTATTATPTWLQLSGDPRLTSTSGVCNSQCFYDIPLAVSPASANDVFFGGSARNGTLIRSIDGGNTWTEISRNNVNPFPADSIHVDMHAIAFSGDGSALYVGNDGGVWKSSSPTGVPNAGFWTNLNQTLQITQFYPSVSIHPSNTGFAMGGTQDNGVLDYQGFSGTTPLLWQDSGLGCDGGFTAIDFNIPSTAYGECEYIPSGLLLIATSFNNGDLVNGSLVTSGINGADRGNFIPPLVMDPNNSNTLYFGTCRIYQTTNNGQSWAAISPDVTSSAHAADCSTQTGPALDTIAIAKGAPAPNVIYAGSDGGEVEVTTNGGTTWTSIAANGGILPARAVTQIVVDPSIPTGDLAYVIFSGFGTCANVTVTCDGKGHVFKTVNGTAGAATAWLDISGTTTKLPDIPVNALVIDPDDAARNTLYVGTDIGVFFTTDGGLNWFPLGAANSLPNAQVLSLTLHNPSRTLRAATHGRGVWDLNLGPGPNTPAFEISSLFPFSANASATAAPITLTVSGTGFTGSSTILWNGSARITRFVSTTQLTATITTADLSGGGVARVSVQDLTVTPNTTNALPFTVLGQAPTLASINPTSTPVQSPAPSGSVNITLTGTNFTANSQVQWNGATNGITVSAPTASCPIPTCLTATLPASLLGPFGSTDDITVVNPPPGGGSSAAQTFKVVAIAPPNDAFPGIDLTGKTTFWDIQDSSGATTNTAGVTDPTPPSTCVQQFTVANGNTGGNPNGVYNTIWYKFTPSSAGTVNLDTMGSNYDSVLSVWTGSAGSLAAVANGCNDDINPGIVTVSQLLNLSLTGGTTYFIMVSSFGPPDPNPVALGGKSVLNFSFTPTADFTMTPQAPTSATVSAGSAATYTVAVGGVNGFSSSVNLTCTLPAAATTCTVTPSSVAPVNNSVNATVKVTTTVRGLLPPIGFRPNGKPLGTLPYGLAAVLALVAFVLFARTKRQRFAHSLLLLVLIFAVLQQMGCGGGGSSAPPPPTGTQAGTYTVTITGISGSTTHTTTVTLVVN